MNTFDVSDLISVFNQQFLATYNTQLIAGDNEPLYMPANNENAFHQVIFAHGYFSSALHEIAHWCIAGDQRRMLVDYGYWYEPDGRTEAQQAQFEIVEIKPQAIEWVLSASCGKPFRVSCDNLSGAEVNRHQFTERVLDQVHSYLESGLPKRAEQLSHALRDFYKIDKLEISRFINLEWNPN
ncbi:elongation factor P hydroxylase [Thaumasiovibrio subtropicus]|uniref:elongation factor P hydroxylase n=1 Tax=Thaumasiovibrio subtropicus TaxID=1891207 RepID=UPI000B3520F4|nr:elongation factor P hydroxylase [Thaumasiovibrio subtropicus]